MLSAPHYREQLSLMLSDVLDDIGVNERMVMKRRKLKKMEETLVTISKISTGLNQTCYIMGSQNEGTTTEGLQSDIDYVTCENNFNIIQDLSEWELGKENYLMIHDENTTPGYCFIQRFQSDEPLPATEIPVDHQKSERGEILCKNTIKNVRMRSGLKQHGPSITSTAQGQYQVRDVDIVHAYPCKSWPQSASGWLKRQGTGGWPTNEMRRFAAETRCFVVPVGSKVSVYPEPEWRLSTSLAERYLMFNLNMTQIRCYVLLKELHSCLQNEHCSHFIISENNLMAGQFTSETNYELSENISDFIQNDRQYLLRIDTDNLGYRLQIKLNIVPWKEYSSFASLKIPSALYIGFAMMVSSIFVGSLLQLQKLNIEEMLQYVAKLVSLKTCIVNDEGHIVYKFLEQLTFTTYGSALASSSIGENNEILPLAFALLSDGLHSDVSSGRLKLASVFYSIGEMEKAQEILRQTEQKYHSHPVFPICSCGIERPLRSKSVDIVRYCNEHNEDCIKHITAFCVRFLRQEINCVPRELQYELFRSTQDDMIHRGPFDLWMEWAVVDSLPFLYFLQYKIYCHLQRQQEKQQALNNLIRTTFTDGNLTHRETALNILGQCMEQENRPNDALHYYIYSLKERTRNNAAKVHLCRLLCKCYSNL